MGKFRVGILGATGAVGQRMIEMLMGHPWFEIGELCASERSAGKAYRDAVAWRMATPLPDAIGSMTVKPCQTPLAVDFVFSALPREQAEDVEPAFARFGTPVISNASAFRDHADVPLVIPEINSDHTSMVDGQRAGRDWKSFIVTNPNCATIGVAIPLAALDKAFGLAHVCITTMQARSGAGYPGPSEDQIGDNVLPHIGGEEDKLEKEPQKILGQAGAPADFVVSAQCNRVNVMDGHLECVSVSLRNKASLDQVIDALKGFQAPPMVAQLPSAPDSTIVLMQQEDRPQPKLDRDLGSGMAISVGRVRPCPVHDFKFVVLSHNTIRGAAGAAILNAELLVKQGYLTSD